MNRWKRLAARVVYRRGAFRLVEERWAVPEGTEQTFPSLRLGPFVVMVAITGDQQIPLVENLHPSPGLRLLELPAGRVDPHESPRHAAQRELEEETGWRPRKLTSLGRYHPIPHWSTVEGHLFLAEHLLEGRIDRDPGEPLRPVLMPVREVYRRLHQGRLRAGNAIVGLSMAEPRLREMGLLPRGAARTKSS
jgi:ADP-ribose pyrophosphatase